MSKAARAGVKTNHPLPPAASARAGAAKSKSRASAGLKATPPLRAKAGVAKVTPVTKIPKARGRVQTVMPLPSDGAALAAPAAKAAQTRGRVSKASAELQTTPSLPSKGAPCGASDNLRRSAATRTIQPQVGVARAGRGGSATAADIADHPPAIGALGALQRQRQFCIISQSRIDRACESFVARAIGLRCDMPEADRKSVFARAAAFRREVERGLAIESGEADGDLHGNLRACIPIVLHSAAARQCWDKHRIHLEKEMQRLAANLPVAPWCAGIRGLSIQGLACIIGETGDLSNYDTKERVWKRLGLAVIDGIAQQKRSKPEEAAAHGFSPKRRAVIWSVADVLLRAQWRGEKEGVPAHPIGPYGAVYGRRKVHTVNREGWTPKRRDNDARRVMSKALIEDLWRVWNGKEPLAAM